MSSSSDKENNHQQLDIPSLLRQQAARRAQERNKICEVAAATVDPEMTRGITSNDHETGIALATAALVSNDNKTTTTFYQDRNDRATNTIPTFPENREEEISSSVMIRTRSSPSPPRCKSPTQDAITTAQLKSRVALLEEETESLRAVVDLARKENAALRNLMLKMAQKTLGNDWRASLGIDMDLGTALAGIGQPAAELTMAQRSRLIELLEGKAPNLLP